MGDILILRTILTTINTTVFGRRRIYKYALEFPVPQMEELVRKVTDRELRLIVRLGYLLGGIIGTVLVGVNALVGR